jgi:hypothetical protein
MHRSVKAFKTPLWGWRKFCVIESQRRSSNLLSLEKISTPVSSAQHFVHPYSEPCSILQHAAASLSLCLPLVSFSRLCTHTLPPDQGRPVFILMLNSALFAGFPRPANTLGQSQLFSHNMAPKWRVFLQNLSSSGSSARDNS